MPFVQVWPAAQTRPQAPQFRVSVVVLEHAPSQQSSVNRQTVPHAPQLLRSLDRSWHASPQQVDDRVPAQSSPDAPHTHAPAAHVSSGSQTLTHDPHASGANASSRRQVPAQQTSPGAQLCPQVPHAAGSLPSRVHAPSQHVSP